MKEYADPIIDKLDPLNKLISKRLYRDSCALKGNFLVKDLLTITSDLSKIVIVDNIADNFVNQPENGIVIKSWLKGDNEDTELIKLSKILLTLCALDDVRVGIKNI